MRLWIMKQYETVWNSTRDHSEHILYTLTHIIITVTLYELPLYTHVYGDISEII